MNELELNQIIADACRIKMASYKYYILLDEEGKRISPGYREDSENIPEDVLENGVLVDKETFGKLVNGYYIDPITKECKEIPPYIPTAEEELAAAKQNKLNEISNMTATAITAGFKSNAGGENATFDSTENDQQNLQIMLNASKSSDFETDPTYQGHIPIRGIPEGQEEKKVYSMNATQMQKLNDDLARHIGSCKIVGWTLQSMVDSAVTKEDVEAITWEAGQIAASTSI